MTTRDILLLASASLAVFNQSMSALAAQKQDHEMNQEEEAEYDRMVSERMKEPHWQKSTG